MARRVWSPLYSIARRSQVSHLLLRSPEPGLLSTAWIAGAWSPVYCIGRRSMVSYLLHRSPELSLPSTEWLAGAWSPAHCMARRSLVSRLLHRSPELGLPSTEWLAGAWSPVYRISRRSTPCVVFAAVIIANGFRAGKYYPEGQTLANSRHSDKTCKSLSFFSPHGRHTVVTPTL
ncbi:hypothetical protein PoB_004710200 [Plakobranchus ocellatus]|uniref:Uncharacterized protein n=1 Tax=Plakobranchus ocellatus TaxID=259542 RepID=A0AAV4BNR2_9GAST|nr:hypothetical protein PoB_004710200 [Plakobranchus ocellatus]